MASSRAHTDRPTSTLSNRDLWRRGTPKICPQPYSDSTQVLLTPAVGSRPRAASCSPQSSLVDPGNLPRRTPRPDSYPCWSYLEPDYYIESVPILSGMTDMPRITPRIILKENAPSTKDFALPVESCGNSSSALTLMSETPDLDVSPTATTSNSDVGSSFVQLPSSSGALTQQGPIPTFSRQDSPPWFWLQGDYSYKGTQPNPKRIVRIRPPTSGRASRTPPPTLSGSLSSSPRT